MKDITTTTNPFLGQVQTVTLAEVMDRVSADMSGTARRDTLSALRSLAKFADFEAATTRAARRLHLARYVSFSGPTGSSAAFIDLGLVALNA